MVTKVTRDVLDLNIREITDGIKITGNCGASFFIDGVPIGLTIPCDGEFVNLGATNLTATSITVTGTLDGTGATFIGTGVVPVGGVVMFNAAFATIPSNWQLCDGTNGTPDMTDQFVYGTNTEGELLDAGGSANAIVVDHTHTIDAVGNHTHGLNHQYIGADSDGGDGDPRISPGTNNGTSRAGGGHTHIAQNAGVSGTNANLPPYIKLAFIQRMT